MTVQYGKEFQPNTRSNGGTMYPDAYDDNEFDVKYVNVAGIKSIVDCDIISRELDVVINEIDAQLSSNTKKDDWWRKSATKAKDSCLHKKELIQLKRDALVNDNYLVKFREAALVVLDKDTLAKIEALVK